MCNRWWSTILFIICRNLVSRRKWRNIVHSNLPIPDSFVLGPQREVISIYDDHFATLPSRPQYFIEVYRCVKVEVSECSSNGPSGYPVPNATAEIETVVRIQQTKSGILGMKSFINMWFKITHLVHVGN